MSKPPNILFLMSDEHRADVTGYEGNSVIRTPVLDELARTGVVFTNAYTPSPICIPGRQALMAGQLPHTCGCYNFGDDLPVGHMTWARRLSQYGYTTACSGKLHHTGNDQMQGWTVRVAADTQVSARYIEGLVDADYSSHKSEPGTGKWSNQKEIERAGIAYGPYTRFDDRVTEGALDFIERYYVDPYYDRPLANKPLCLKASYLQPHYPFYTSEELFNYYLNRVPIYQEERADHPVLARTQAGPPVEASPRDIRRATAAYYGMIETVDMHCGTVMEALEEVGQDLDDWIIVYTTDHGDMMGQHGIWEKTQFYEASARVPLIVRWPKRFAPRVVTENVNLCDLFATLCELAGIPTPTGLDSRSLVPLLEGAATDWDNETISEIGKRMMIKRDDLKYCWYGPDVPEVLFDLATDPGELTNRIDDAAYAPQLAAFRERRDALVPCPS